MQLKCEFKYSPFIGHNSLLTCAVLPTSIKEPNIKVHSIYGLLLEKSFENVEAVAFEDSPDVEYLPRGLGIIFPNLKALKVSNCGLKEISRNDLDDLEMLEEVELSSNPIESLPSNLFNDMLMLRRISFANSKIKFVSPNLFKPIAKNGMAHIDFRGNAKVNTLFDPSKTSLTVTLQQLMNLIVTNCTEPADDEQILINGNFFINEVQKGFSVMWESRHLSDFTIIVGSKKIRVHKIVLAIQSSVFAAMFESKMLEQKESKMNIGDFSSGSVEQFIGYMYTGEVPDESYAMEIYALAAKYDVSKLKSMCEKVVLKNVSEENAYEVYALGHIHSQVEMKEKAFAIIISLFPDKSLPDNLMNDPESSESYVVAAQNLLKAIKAANDEHELKVEVAQKNFDSVWKNIEKKEPEQE